MQSADNRWVTQLFETVDGRDADAFASFLDPEVQFRFANAAPVRGREPTRQMVAGFFSSIAALRHRLEDIWHIADQRTVICRGEVSYVRHDGGELQVPFVVVLIVGEGGIREYSIYVDAAQLYA